MAYRIPFNVPYVIGTELGYIQQAFESRHLCGDGPFTKRCHGWFEQRLGRSKVLLTTSCTTALEMAGLLCDIHEGDEVILPTFTFVSTANAFFLRGAKIRFVDVRPDTLNLDEAQLEGAINERTRAILPVHYAGVSCEMDTINAIAKERDLVVIEDAAQGVDAAYKGQALGTLGDIGTFSFHATKNFSCGEGGAMILNREEWWERAEIIREKGTNRSQFFRGQVDKYTWVDVGSSFLPSDILAAFLYAQLEAVDDITARRKAIYEGYQQKLEPLAAQGAVTLPTIPEECDTNYHMFYMLLPDLETRSALIEHLKQKGIQAVFHYVPLHTATMGKRMGYKEGMFPVAESVADRLVRLPFYNELSPEQVEEVAAEINAFFGVQ